MRLAHLADLHLGFRQFDRTTEGGRNTRETDVAIALGRAIDDVIAQRPDVVAIAGDVFHQVRPPNTAILTFVDQFARLRAALPDAVIVMVAGNHDTPRTTETGFILPLVERLDIDLALLEPKVIEIPDGIIVAVPSAAAARIPEVPAGPGLKVLVLHAGVAGFSGPAPRDAADPAALELAGWDYVALGDYHVAAQVGRRAWYSGALEYTATDAWGELKKQNELGVDGKGWLLVTLEPGRAPDVAFRPIGPTRRFVDLPPIEGTGLGAAELDAAIADRIAEVGSLAGAVVRLVVREVTREVRRALNHKQIGVWKGEALNLQIDLRRAEHQISPTARAARFKALDEHLAEFLGARTLDPAIDRAAFVERGMAAFADVGLDPKRDPYTGEKVTL